MTASEINELGINLLQIGSIIVCISWFKYLIRHYSIARFPFFIIWAYRIIAIEYFVQILDSLLERSISEAALVLEIRAAWNFIDSMISIMSSISFLVAALLISSYPNETPTTAHAVKGAKVIVSCSLLALILGVRLQHYWGLFSFQLLDVMLAASSVAAIGLWLPNWMRKELPSISRLVGVSFLGWGIMQLPFVLDPNSKQDLPQSLWPLCFDYLKPFFAPSGIYFVTLLILKIVAAGSMGLMLSILGTPLSRKAQA